MAEAFKRITAEEFANLDFSKYTLLDLREPDEVLVHGIEGAINLPFSQIGTKLSDVPKDKPVIVYCRVGDWSEEVAEILADRGYEAINLEDGYKAYRAYLESQAAPAEKAEAPKPEPVAAPAAEAPKAAPEAAPAEVVFIDAKGLKCPGPIVKVADALKDLPDGTTVSIEATEDAFYSDIAVWAERTGNTLVSNDYDPSGPLVKTVITKGGNAAAAEKTDGPALYEPREHEKTMVVFSGDLDKTIAAFIMANGAAALGRPVTIFFTFWGLNVLRRPEKVSVKKNLIETAFGLMMP
ncbi:MAG: DsrE/DsrF/DrsH-like family protein, partial [Clostridia bacterium]|nr:DsrE/DsrF/DrsH-like family protein [Clostridia bacterium]